MISNMKNEPSTISYCYETKKLVEQIESSFLVLAERLHKIYHQNLWQGEWDSWEEFTSDIKISRATASKLISVFDTYVLEYKMEPAELAAAGWSGLYELLPMVTDKSTAEECVTKATTLRREEIREELREHKHGRCDHSELVEVHFMQCKHCGYRSGL